jgi:hypothetical protein
MTIAFLIVTINNPLIYLDYLIENNYNIYIHPKNIDNIDKKYKKYIIHDIVKTSWGFIRKAIINLLKEAYKNENNKFFMLCSGDSFIYNKEYISNYNNELNYNKELSVFSFSKKYKGIYKSSTWWILNRYDANIICSTKNKYINIFNNIKLNGGDDEHYFLTVLKKEIKNYKFYNHKYTYTRWLQYSPVKHPVIFNKLTEYDIYDIKKYNIIFLRKILPTFSIIKYNIKKLLYIIFIGYETKNLDFYINNNIDIIIVTSIDISNINKILIEKSICIYQIIFKYYYEFIIDICLTYNKYLLQWSKGIIFINEIFNIKKIKMDKELKSLPYNNFSFKNDNIKKKLFNYLVDIDNNISFFISNTNLKNITLKKKDINFISPL